MTATATVGGVFDVERFFLSGIASTTTPTVPLYVAYLLLAYDDIYGVYERRSDVFRPPYAATVAGLFDMRHDFDDVVAALPPTSRELLTACYLRAVTTDPDEELRVRLRQNAVDRWRPRAMPGRPAGSSGAQPPSRNRSTTAAYWSVSGKRTPVAYTRPPATATPLAWAAFQPPPTVGTCSAPTTRRATLAVPMVVSLGLDLVPAAV